MHDRTCTSGENHRTTERASPYLCPFGGPPAPIAQFGQSVRGSVGRALKRGRRFESDSGHGKAQGVALPRDIPEAQAGRCGSTGRRKVRWRGRRPGWTERLGFESSLRHGELVPVPKSGRAVQIRS